MKRRTEQGVAGEYGMCGCMVFRFNLLLFWHSNASAGGLHTAIYHQIQPQTKLKATFVDGVRDASLIISFTFYFNSNMTPAGDLRKQPRKHPRGIQEIPSKHPGGSQGTRGFRGLCETKGHLEGTQGLQSGSGHQEAANKHPRDTHKVHICICV